MLKDTRAQGYMMATITLLIATIIAFFIVMPTMIEVMELTLDTYPISTPSSLVQATANPVVESTPVQNVGEPVKTTNLNIHAEKTNVVVGEDILIKLSAVNFITKKTMHIQVILVPPSGMSVSASTFVFSGAGQYTSDFRVEPGQGRDIEISLLPNQAGDFNVEGRVIYYFGDDIINSEDYRISVPVHVTSGAMAVETGTVEVLGDIGSTNVINSTEHLVATKTIIALVPLLMLIGILMLFIRPFL